MLHLRHLAPLHLFKVEQISQREAGGPNKKPKETQKYRAPMLARAGGSGCFEQRENSEGQTLNGKPFTKGTSGNPAGRPKGARSKRALALEALLEADAEEIVRTAIDKAKDGDGVALRLCLERIIPPKKDRPVTFPLPPIQTAADATKAASALLEAVGVGSVSPSEATEISRLIESFIRVVEVSDLEERLAALEQRTAQ